MLGSLIEARVGCCDMLPLINFNEPLLATLVTLTFLDDEYPPMVESGQKCCYYDYFC